jgi:hypothetical protein
LRRVAARPQQGGSHQYHYKVSAIDLLWNESEVTSPSELVAVPDPETDGIATPEPMLTLGANAPNPFNPVTMISFTIPGEQQVSLHVYDVAGRLVCTLIDGILPAGEYESLFDGGGLASGVYFYRLETPADVLIRKMTLIR